MEKYIKIILLTFLVIFLASCNSKAENLEEETIKSDIKVENIISKEKQSCVNSDEVNIYIYMYHYVRNKNWDNPNVAFLNNSMLPENFEKHMAKFKKLEKEETIITSFMSDLEIYKKENCFPNKNIVILTADDGWDDNYINLYPIVNKYSLKFNLGIISGKIKEKRFGNFMNLKELKEVSENENFEIQGHTYSHPDLRYSNNLEKEICQSKKDLEEIIGKEINTLVYPDGKYDPKSLEKTKSCGYKYGLTTKVGFNSYKNLETNNYKLERIRVSRNTNINNLIKYFQ